MIFLVGFLLGILFTLVASYVLWHGVPRLRQWFYTGWYWLVVVGSLIGVLWGITPEGLP